MIAAGLVAALLIVAFILVPVPPSSPEGVPPPVAGSADPALWGYAYIKLTDIERVPIDSEYVIGPAQWSTSGQKLRLQHRAPGGFTVVMPGLASASGIPHVTASDTSETNGRTCTVADFGPSGADQRIEVRCFDKDGSAVDTPFNLFFGAPSTGSTPQATISYRDAIEAGHNYNSAGGVNRVERSGTDDGHYRAILGGLGSAAVGVPKISTVGVDGTSRCDSESIRAVGNDIEVIIACHRISSSDMVATRGVNSPWLLTYVSEVGLPHDDGVESAFLATGGTPSAPVIDRSFSSIDETPTIARVRTGRYEIKYGRLGYASDGAQVSAINDHGHFCQLGTVNTAAAPAVTIVVQCYDRTGAAADTHFSLAYLRGR